MSKLSDDTISTLRRRLDGCDYGQGALEDASRTATKASECLANLVQLLAEKEIISEDEIEDVLLRGCY